MTDNMKDRLKESLSALMDGEADELEIRRLLNQMEDPELQEQWKRQHMLSAIMRDEPMGDLDLTAVINAGIDGKQSGTEPQQSSQVNEQGNNPTGWLKSLGSVAIAASVTLAVLLGVQSLEPGSAETGSLVQQPPELIESRQQVVQSTSEAPEAGLSAQELEKSQQQLQEFLRQNPESPDLNGRDGVNPYARVVNFADKTEAEPDK